jgi:hypothetical protein
MKKLIITLAAGMFLLSIIPAQAEIKRPSKNQANTTEVVESPEITVLINRVNEINAMDKSALSSSEKKVLRKELRNIKKHVNENSHHHGGVIYISGGVILLIILLIILL